MKDFLIFGKPDIGQAEINAVTEVLKSGWLSTGPVVQVFQKEFERFIGEGYAVAVSSCTEALICSLLVANVKPGQEVLVPAITFCATANAVLNVGAKPIFCEVTPSGHIDPNLIDRYITPATVAIIPVHYTGAPCDMDAIHHEATKYGLTVIEDAAHGFGGTYKTKDDLVKKIGTLSDYSCFSLYPTKNITSAEGGIVMLKDPEKAARIKILILNGLSSNAWKRYGKEASSTYQVIFPGRKGNMSDVHAALGLTQLRRWSEISKKRDAVWEVYEKAFGKKEEGHSKHLYTIRHPKRDALRQYLFNQGIGTGIHFTALHLEPAYKSLGCKIGSLPKAERISAETLSLPMSSMMTKGDAEKVVKTVKEF